MQETKTIAMVGLSSNPFRPSHFAAIYMLAEGYTVIPVNPREIEILGQCCYASLSDIPVPVDRKAHIPSGASARPALCTITAFA